MRPKQRPIPPLGPAGVPLLLGLLLLGGCVAEMERTWEDRTIRFIQLNQTAGAMIDADQIKGMETDNYVQTMLDGDVLLDQMRSAKDRGRWADFQRADKLYILNENKMRSIMARGDTRVVTPSSWFDARAPIGE